MVFVRIYYLAARRNAIFESGFHIFLNRTNLLLFIDLVIYGFRLNILPCSKAHCNILNRVPHISKYTQLVLIYKFNNIWFSIVYTTLQQGAMQYLKAVSTYL